MIMRRGGGWLEMEREDWTRGLFSQWCASHQVYPTYLYLLPDFSAVFFHIFHWYLWLEKTYQQESVELHLFPLSQPLTTIKVNIIKTIPTNTSCEGSPSCHVYPTYPYLPIITTININMTINTKFKTSRFSLVSPSTKVTSFKSQDNKTSQSGWKSERVSDKQEKSMVLVQCNMDWIGLYWLAGTGVSLL